MTKSTMELIQERIDMKQQELEWMENNPEVHHYIYNQTMNQCLISELKFLGELIKSLNPSIMQHGEDV